MNADQAGGPLVTMGSLQSTSPHPATRLQDLPPELLRRIFENVVLQGNTFYFWPRENNKRTRWSIRSTTTRPDPAVELKNYTECTSCGCRSCVGESMYKSYGVVTNPRHAERMDCSLFYVNKAIAAEARAAFFAGNVFAITINAQAHVPLSLKSPLIFGPLGQPHQLHVLRDLQHIMLRIEIDEDSSHAVVRQRARTQYFVDVLKEHAEDHNKKSLLKTLEVRIRGHFLHPADRRARIDTHMFVLEVLTGLQGIGDVKILGLQPWFAQCLSLHLTGQGGQAVSKLDWPMRVTRRRRSTFAKFQKTEVTTREYWQPMLNWKEYAVRNGIELPEDIDKYFPQPEEQP